MMSETSRRPRGRLSEVRLQMTTLLAVAATSWDLGSWRLQGSWPDCTAARAFAADVDIVLLRQTQN